MTNEELAVRIQAGETAYKADLWEAVRKLLYKLVYPYSPFAERLGLDMEDLLQESYFAMEAAVQAYRPEAGYAFSTYLGRQARKAVRTLLYYWNGKRRYVETVSLDTPVGEEDTPLRDLLPSGAVPFEETTTDQIQHGELRETMRRRLRPDEYTVIQLRYWQCLPLKETGAQFGHGAEWAREQERRALKRLRHFRYEFADSYCYRHKGLTAYKSSLSSVVEDVVLQRDALLQSALPAAL